MLKRLVLCLFAMPGLMANADDWPQWRGVNRNASLSSQEQIESLPSDKIELSWSVPIGGGYSAPSVAKGRVYVMDRGSADATSEIERVLCFDAATGKNIWDHTYEAKYTISYRAGPRAAVTIQDDKVYSVGAMGQFHCLDAASGDVIWMRDLAKDYAAKMPIWGITGSPLVYKGIVIQIAAGSSDDCVVALDAQTGKEKWHALNERAGYSSPILIQQGGQDVVVCWTGESVTGLDPVSGKVFWSVPMLPRKMPIGVPTPVVSGNTLFVASFYDGSMVVDLNPEKPRAKKAWARAGVSEKNTDALHSMISNPIIKGDHIYGVDSYGELRCLDLKTGDRVWENKTAVRRSRWATIHTIQNGDREIMLNEQGELIMATLSPKGYAEHSRAKLIAPTKLQLNRREGVTWAHPAIANGHIFARSDRELVCAKISE